MFQTSFIGPFSSRDLLKAASRIANHYDLPPQESNDFDLTSTALKLDELPACDLISIDLEVLESQVNHLDPKPSEELHDVPDSSDNNDAQDVWQDLSCPQDQSWDAVRSWTQFEGSSIKKKVSLIEASRSRYDSVIAQSWQQDHPTSLKHIQTHAFKAALRNVVIGRSSALFVWNAEEKHFTTSSDTFTISGHSHSSTYAVCQRACQIGTTLRRLQSFAADATRASPTVYTIKSAVSHILQAIECDWALKVGEIQSFVTFQASILEYEDLLQILETWSDLIVPGSSDADYLSSLMLSIEQIWLGNLRLQNLMSNVARNILSPAIESTCQMLGASLNIDTKPHEERWLLDIILPDHVKEFKDATQCCELLSILGEDALPINQQTLHTEMNISWPCTFQELHKISIFQPRESPALRTIPSGHEQLPTDPFRPDLAMTSTSELHATLGHDIHSIELAVQQYLSGKSHSVDYESLSPMGAIRNLMCPIIIHQHLSSSHRLLTVLFEKYGLKAQFEVLHEFMLLGNIDFVERLQRALFDSDEGSAEGRRATGVTAGLRMEERKAWPPSSTELRLVLLGVMPSTDTLSFSLRDLSSSEQEKASKLACINALDFLQLSYNSPNAVLDYIISPHLLDKYNNIFRHLLVLLRLQSLAKTSVASHVLHDAKAAFPSQRRFWHHFHHFVTTWLDYAMSTAIKEPWHRFMRKINSMGDALYQKHPVPTTLSSLYDDHKTVVQDMEQSLLLTTSSSSLRRSLQSILNYGLSMHAVGGSDTTSTDRLIKSIAQFATEIRLAIANASDPAFLRLQRLLLCLDMSDKNTTDQAAPRSKLPL